MSNPLAQLVDMGIPRSRARAALKRTKDDVMSAAERVFAGDFDDIPSDEELEPEETTMPTPRVTPPVESDAPLVDDDDDNDEAEDSMDEGMEEEYYDDDLDTNMAQNNEYQTTSDPYANVFFSKDRVEEIIEPIVLEREVGLFEQEIDDGESSHSGQQILSRAEWMRGCPEGNEQSFLFQHYTYLESGEVPCPAGCGSSFERSPTDFFSLQLNFTFFEEHVRGTARRTCENCSQVVCMACGEKVKAKGGETGKGKGSSKQDSTGNADKAGLLHCPNLQGVMIGMGLYMIEQTFRPKASTSPAASPTLPPAKRAKTLEVENSSLTKRERIEKMIADVDAKVEKHLAMLHGNDEDDDDDDSWGLMNSAGEFSDRMPRRTSAKGTGYAGSGREDISGQIAAAKAERLRDRATTTVLKQVQYYLPSLAREGGPCVSDHMVHPTALAHLRRRSTFVNTLLRNESLLDMSLRGDLYRALLDWLKVISNHESLASMLAMPQMQATSTKPSPTDPSCQIVTYEGSASPRELLENCVIQAKAAIKGLDGIEKSTLDESKTTKKKTQEEKARTTMSEAAKHAAERRMEDDRNEDVQLRLFCQRIVDAAEGIDRSLTQVKGEPFVERMRASLPKIPDTGDQIIETKGTSFGEAVIKIYEEWATRARFQYCDMSDSRLNRATTATVDNKDKAGAIAYRHHFDSSLRHSSENAFRGRMRAIAQEMGILSTSLPVAWHSTIFVRVDSTRPDCLKAMITGPQGTPYENGCFLFDIYLPESYNTTSPKVQFMTTNGGMYRYNPNLYADGKVCLSLLGTWQGPGWISGKSTLLQVLISIQSLILCEEPYLNEPGWSSQGGSAASKSYSANVRRMVLKDAMANNLKNPPFPFENEIKTHFRLKKDSIKAQIEEWKKLDDGKGVENDSYTGIHYPHMGEPEAAPVASGPKTTAFDQAASQLIGLLDEMEDD